MQPNVLIAPLDWGLGHATRCVPIIKELQVEGINPIIATSGAPETLLKKEFPDLEFINLPGYNIRYTSGSGFTAALLRQLPHAFSVMQGENNWVKNIIRKKKISAIISDNRPGFYSRTVPSVYITHQLNLKTGNKLLDKLGQRVHYHFINRFSQCWVPDSASAINLAGELSHPEKLPSIKVEYIGPVSRFEKLEMDINIDILFLLSGPEPQRSYFENQLIGFINEIHQEQIVFIRGLPNGGGKILQGLKNVRVYDHVNALDLNNMIAASEKVVARGGYSTIMDLTALQKPALLVPTPGQKEQEYLCDYLRQKKYFNTCQQARLGYKEIVQAFENKPVFIAPNLKDPIRQLKSMI